MALEQKEKRYADERAAAEAQNLPFVKLNMTLVFTAFKSLGTGTYANFHHLRQWAWNRLLARELVLNSVKHSSTVYPMHVHMAAEMLLSTTMFWISTA